MKILDFGIAKALVQDTTPVNSMTLGLTQFQEVMGSPMYMSPEQVRGTLIDHRSDIYSLGVTMHTLLMGRNPYDGMNITSTFDMQDAVVNRSLPPLTGSLSLFEPLIQRATQKNPAHRYPSVQLLLDDLNQLNIMALPNSWTGFGSI
ncbi:MAG: protein kinase [Spirosoma sp.]|nr:protein kinase [Spirosoma sp.]